ncbi:hypothetical protein X975_17788, partial [Stegodyphus mimosarum]
NGFAFTVELHTITEQLYPVSTSCIVDPIKDLYTSSCFWHRVRERIFHN